jgi:hypothetical protein
LNPRGKTPAAHGIRLRASADSLEAKLIAVEQNIVDLRLSGRGQDEVRWPVMLGGRLSYLAGGVGASDFTPTSQQREVQQLLAKQVVQTRAALDRVMQTDLAAFNRLLTAKRHQTDRINGTAVRDHTAFQDYDTGKPRKFAGMKCLSAALLTTAATLFFAPVAAHAQASGIVAGTVVRSNTALPAPRRARRGTRDRRDYLHWAGRTVQSSSSYRQDSTLSSSGRLDLHPSGPPW